MSRYLKFLYRLYPASPMIPEYAIAKKLANKYSCRRIIDVGCGRGSLAKILDYDLYVGIDLNDDFIKAPKALFIKADANNVAVSGQFDCAFFVNSLFYLSIEALQKYSRLARYLIVIDIEKSAKYLPNLFIDFLEGNKRIGSAELRAKAEAIGLKAVEYGTGGQYYIVFTRNDKN